MKLARLLLPITVLFCVDTYAADSEVIAVSPDNSRLAVAFDDERVVRIFSLADGQLIAQSAPYSGELQDLNFNADNTQLVGGAYESVAFVWDAATGKQTKLLYVPGEVYRSFFTKNGGVGVVAERGFAVYSKALKREKVYDEKMFKGKTKQEIEHLLVSSPLMDVPPTMQYSSKNNGIRGSDLWVRGVEYGIWDVWDVTTVTRLGAVQSDGTMMISPNGEGWAFDYNTIEVWDLKKQILLRSIVLEEFNVYKINYISFSRDNVLAAITVENNNNQSAVIILNIADNTVKTIIKPATTRAYATKFLDEKRLLIDSSYPIEVWDVETNKKLLNIIKNGSQLGLSLFDIKKQDSIPFLTQEGFNAIAVNMHGEIAVSSNENLLMDSNGKLKQFFNAHYDSAHDIRFSPSGDLVAFAYHAEHVLMFDVKTGKLIKQYDLGGVPSATKTLQFSPDGKYLLAGSDDGKLWLIDLDHQTFRKVQSFSSEISALLWIDNDTVLVGTADELAKVTVSTKAKTTILEDDVTALAGYLEAGKIQAIAIGRYDADMLLLDEALQPIKTLPHQNVIRLYFTEDGQTLAATSYHKLGVWNVNNGEGCEKTGFEKGELTGMALDKKRKIVITGEAEKVLRFDLTCRLITD